MKMIQIRNVPEDVHSALKQRATERGTTMSDLIGRELPRIASQAELEEVFARIDRRGPAGPGPSGAELVRKDRDSH